MTCCPTASATPLLDAVFMELRLRRSFLYNDGELPRSEVLLILEVRVGHHKDSESFLLSGIDNAPFLS